MALENIFLNPHNILDNVFVSFETQVDIKIQMEKPCMCDHSAVIMSINLTANTDTQNIVP